MNLLPFPIFNVLFTFLLCLLSWPAQSLNLTVEEKQWIAQNPVVILGSDRAWPPYDFLNEQGEHDGISADIIEIIRQKTGLDIRIKSGVWSDIMSEVKQGQLDGLVCAVQTPEREVFLNFTPPYTTMPLGILIRSETRHISSLADLKGKRVAINRDSYLHEWLVRQHPEIVLHLTSSNKEALSAVSFNEADAYIGNIAVATYLIKKNYLTNLSLVAKVDEMETQTAIAIDKQQPILMSIIQKALQDISPLTLRTINENWYAKSQLSHTQALQQPVPLTAKERAWIARYGEVHVAVELDWPPFNFVDDSGIPKGLSIDYLKLIAQKTGLQLTFTTNTWPENLQALEDNRVDLLPAGVKNRQREQFARFSEPYFEANNYFFVRNDLGVTHIEELDGKTVAIPKGFAGIELIQTYYPNITVLEVASMQEAIEAVLQNRAQMLFSLYPVASYFLKKTGVTSIMPFKATLQGAQNVRFLVRDELPELQSILNKGLASISAAEKAAIDIRWFITNIQPKLELNHVEQEWMRAHPVVNVSVEFDWPPFDFVDQNQTPVGLSIDYLKLVGDKTGLKFEMTVDRWTTNLEHLKNKTTDLLPATFQTEERKQFSLFSDPYFEARYYFFVQDDLQVETLNDLNGKTVAVPKGFAQITTLRQFFPNISILETDSMQEAIEAVIQNKAQMLYDVYPVLAYSLKKSGVNTIVPFKATHQALQGIHFMVRNDAPELVSILNKGLQAITETEKNLIESKWLVQRQASGYKPEFELTELEREWLRNNPMIRFTGDPDWLPFESFDSKGNYSGIVADFLTEIERQLPLLFKPIIVSSWQEALSLAKSFEVDVISGDADDAFLSQNYMPIDPYITVPIVMVMEGETEFVNHLSELKDKSLGIVKGYGYTHALLAKYKGYQFIEFENPLELLESVSTGKTDVALLSLPVASYLIKQHAFYLLNIVGKTELDMQLTLFVSKELPVLHSLLNRAMQAVKENKGEKILNSWTNLSFASKMDYALLAQILLVFLLVMGVVFYWNLKLNREVKQRKRIEAQLKAERDKFEYLFDKAADGHLIVQRNKIVAVNDAALALLGLKDKRIILQQGLDSWCPEVQPDGQRSAVKRKAFIERCFNQGMVRFDWMLKDVNGVNFWVDVVYVSIPYLGRPAIYMSWRDKSEQKALEETLKQNEAQMKRIIDSIPLIVLITNMNGNILNANRKALNDYNVSSDDISAFNITDFYLNPEDRAEVIQQLQQQGRVEQKIVTVKDIHGQPREMMLSVTPITYHNQPALLTISVDLTERILAEKKLKEAMEHAKAANQSKTEFLANMSHEIRTPMNAILGFTELLNEQVTEPRLKSFIHTIQSAGNTLLMLINDILDLSKIEAGKMTIQKTAVNPHDLFQEVADIFMINIQKKGLDFYIEIAPDIPQLLLLDPVRLRQVLFNLLGNAVKFTERGLIKLSVRSINEFKHLSKVDLLIQVEDTGIGIPFDQQDRIFNVFEQQEGQDSGKFGGTGLGLSITKRLVSMMKGHISVQSAPEKGSIFTILLEKVDVASVRAYDEFSPPEVFDPKTIRFKPATILVVDDVLNNRELICQHFIDSDLTILQAKNGQEAIECYQTHSVDLILMDIRMPVLSGYEAAKVIKSLNPEVPIVALTASVMQDEFEKVKRAYFDDYLRKPVLRQDLIQTLLQFLAFYQIKGEEHQDNTSYLTVFDEQSLSESIKEAIKSELVPLYCRAISSNSLEDIGLFAHTAAQCAQLHQHEALQQFASQLLEKVDSFDISGMQYLLKQVAFLKTL